MTIKLEYWIFANIILLIYVIGSFYLYRWVSKLLLKINSKESFKYKFFQKLKIICILSKFITVFIWLIFLCQSLLMFLL